MDSTENFKDSGQNNQIIALLEKAQQINDGSLLHVKIVLQTVHNGIVSDERVSWWRDGQIPCPLEKYMRGKK